MVLLSYGEHFISVWSFSNWSTQVLRLRDSDWLPQKSRTVKLSWPSLVDSISHLLPPIIAGGIKLILQYSTGRDTHKLRPSSLWSLLMSLSPLLIFSVSFHRNQLWLWVWNILSPVSLCSELRNLKIVSGTPASQIGFSHTPLWIVQHLYSCSFFPTKCWTEYSYAKGGKMIEQKAY